MPERVRVGIIESLKIRRDVKRHHNPDVPDTRVNKTLTDNILTACKIAFGDKCDVERANHDPLLSRINSYFVALNDWLDVGIKLENSPEKTGLKEELDRHTKKLNLYFNDDQTTALQDTIRRSKMYELFQRANREIIFIETSLSDCPDGIQGYQYVKKSKELINAIEIILDIQATTSPDAFESRFLEEDNQQPNFSDLEKRYQWIVDKEYPDEQLTEDEKKARMLFFTAMTIQVVADINHFEQDREYSILKPTTYLTEKLGFPKERAIGIAKSEADDYRDLAVRYGMSPRLVKGIEKATGAAIKIANKAVNLARLPFIGPHIYQKILNHEAARQAVEVSYKYKKDI